MTGLTKPIMTMTSFTRVPVAFIIAATAVEIAAAAAVEKAGFKPSVRAQEISLEGFAGLAEGLKVV